MHTASATPSNASILAADEASPIVVISHFKVANGIISEVKAAFRDRPHLVDNAPGFIRMEVMIPHDDADMLWLLTFWKDTASYETWHHSHLYHDSHARMPKGLKLVPGQTKIRTFEHVCS